MEKQKTIDKHKKGNLAKGIAALGVGLMFFTACSSAPELISEGTIGEEEEESESSSSEVCGPGGGGGTASGEDNIESIYNYITSSGYSDEMAAGIAGNFDAEANGGDPTIAEEGYEDQWGWDVADSELRGWGIAQWTFERHAEVREHVEDELGREYYVSQFSDDDLDEDEEQELLEAQLDFLFIELEDGYTQVYDEITDASSPEDAAEVFVRDFEIPANIEQQVDERTDIARDIYDDYEGNGGGSDDDDDDDDSSDISEDCVGGSGDGGAGTGENTGISPYEYDGDFRDGGFYGEVCSENYECVDVEGVDVTVPDVEDAGDASGQTIEAPNEQAAFAMAVAFSYIGMQYSWGGGNGAGPTEGCDGDCAIPQAIEHGDPDRVGFDCSGLVGHAWYAAGGTIELTDDSRITVDDIVNGGAGGESIDRDDMEPGDVKNTGSGGQWVHNGMYIGDIDGTPYWIEAPSPGDNVRIVETREGDDNHYSRFTSEDGEVEED